MENTDPFMSDVIAFVAADEFQTKFERFFLEHAETFEDDEEHKLIYHDIYLEFQNMFDGELEHFCEMNGITRSDFYRKCKEAAETDPKAMHYIQILLSSAEYETFVRLMRIMKPIAKMKKSDEKSSGDSGGSKGGKGGGDDFEGEELEEYPRAEEKSSGDNRRGAKGGGDDDDDFDGKGEK